MGLFVLMPVRVGLFVVSDEDTEQDDHGDLPDEADRGETDPHVGGLGDCVVAVALSHRDLHLHLLGDVWLMVAEGGVSTRPPDTS